MNKRYKYGIILSGGAARGFAHAGILKALHEHDIYPDAVSGVSAGAIVGAFYADGFSPDEILEIFKRKKLFKFVSICAPRTGFLEMTGLREILAKNLRSKGFDELEKPLWITVTNYKTGKPEYLYTGNLLDAIIASCSIPALFRPHKLEGEYYVDGGVTNNFPVEALLDHCEELVGAYVDPVGIVSEPRGVFHTALRSFQLSISSQVRDKKRYLSYYIEPLELARYGLLEVSKGQEMFDAGYKAARKTLEDRVNSKNST